MTTINTILTQTGDTADVSLTQNASGAESEAAVWTVPERHDNIAYRGDQHQIRGRFRAKETFAGAGAATLSLSTDIQAIAGEEAIEDQPYPVAVAVDTTAGSEVAIESVDYAANEVTIASADFTGGNDYAVYPVIVDGTFKVEGRSQFDDREGTLTDFGVGLRNFADVDQQSKRNAVRLNGAISAGPNEKIAFLVESDAQVVWDDADYPGAYASTIELECTVTY
ncbi:hypothetical protein DVK00_02845 [Haloarcula sp. Atlit-47R]|uniref:hypothetical protein n=1 Tax=Haloarcula sp. Atlit-47R TaxID=2282132 RepID=UPI000EF1E965|nr:hypothetical protein [Haloarcula sp. Atlit-47R]RLM47462.1 hypothetical protein DVK00_02845 [Haloarcula sp. Atlit-47R]